MVAIGHFVDTPPMTYAPHKSPRPESAAAFTS